MVDNKKRSSYCADTSCVEVDTVSYPGLIQVYDENGNRCTYSKQEWVDFVLGVKAGEFDV